MPEKLIPDVEFFAKEIAQELKQDISVQLLKTTERLINFSPEKMNELHLQDWYGLYWKILDFLKYANIPTDKKEHLSNQLLTFAKTESNPVRRQYFALALLLVGKIREFQALADFNLWPKNLREDFNTFSNLNKLINLGTNLNVRACVRRNGQIKNFLQNKYSDLIKKYSNAEINYKTCPKVAQKDYQIYFCWLQGEENLPPLVRCCYNSLKQNAGNYKVVFIDEKNFSDYVTLPEHIVKKSTGGGVKGISRTHFSDILRINLLERYGGLWLDATVLVTEPLEKYKYFWKMPYYTQKFYQERDIFGKYATFISYGRWAGFIQGTAVLHNPLFTFAKEFFNEYWQEYDEIINYLLLDCVMDLAYDNIPAVKKEFDAVPINNKDVYFIQDHLNAPYEKFPYDKILKDNFLNKLSWKIPLNLQTPDTVFKIIQKKYLGE